MRELDFRNSSWHQKVTNLIKMIKKQPVKCNEPSDSSESFEPIEPSKSFEPIEPFDNISNHVVLSTLDTQLPGTIQNTD